MDWMPIEASTKRTEMKVEVTYDEYDAVHLQKTLTE